MITAFAISTHRKHDGVDILPNIFLFSQISQIGEISQGQGISQVLLAERTID